MANNIRDFARLEDIKKSWPQVIQEIRTKDKLLYATLNSDGVIPVDVDKTSLLLEVPNDFFLRKLEDPNGHKLISAVLEKYVGVFYDILVTVRTPKLSDTRNSETNQTASTQTTPGNAVDSTVVEQSRVGVPNVVTTAPEPTTTQTSKRDFWRDPRWQAAGVIVGALLAILPFLFSVYILPKKELQVIIDSSTSLVDVRPEAVNDIEIRYKGQLVTNASVMQVRVVNSGNQPISEEDFSRRLSFEFDPQTQIIDYQVTNSNPPNIGMVLTQTVQYKIEALPLLLNAGDATTIRFIVIRQDASSVLDSFRTDSRIEGIKNVPLISPSDANSRGYSVPLLIALIVLLGIVLNIFNAFLYPTKQAKKVSLLVAGALSVLLIIILYLIPNL